MKFKKLSVVLSALCMMMTISINGTERDIIIADAVSSAETSEKAYSGNCGENAVWEFNPENGTLTISGTGYLNDYINYVEGSNQPWNDYKDDIISIVVEDGITGIGNTFYNFENLKSITVGNNCNMSSCMLYNCPSLEEIIAGDNCTFNAIVNSHTINMLKKITAGDNCNFHIDAFGIQYEIPECIINGTINSAVNFIEGSPFRQCIDTMSLKYDRPVLDYKYKDNKEHKTNTALSNIIRPDNINIKNTTSSPTSFNNGYNYVDKIQEIQDSNGKIYAVIPEHENVSIIPYDADKKILTLMKENFTSGAVVFDNEDNIYVLWAQEISDYNIEEAIEKKYENVVITKYDRAGNILKEYGIPIDTLEAQFPYSSGNAHIC